MTKEKQFVREKESPLALGSLTKKKQLRSRMVALCNGQTNKRIKQKQEQKKQNNNSDN